jgi:hypothetical protein
MQRTRTRARFRRIPELARRTPGGRSGGTGGGGAGSGGVAEALLGLSNFSAANFMQTAAGGGEAGAGTGFGTVEVFRLRQLPSALGVLMCRLLATAGYQHYIAAGGVFNSHNGTGAGPNALTASFIASDVGRIQIVVSRITAVPGVHELYCNGVWLSVPQTAYVPASMSLYLGNNDSLGYPASTVDSLGLLAFRGVPTRAQLEALVAAIRTRGDVPDAMDGAVITHRWSLRDELRGTVVVDGQTAPAQLTDTVTRAPVDALARQGSPVVRVIDQSADGRRLLGAMGFSASSRLETSPGRGIQGAAAGFHVFAVARWDVVPPVITQQIVHAIDLSGVNGWTLQTFSNALRCVIVSGGTAYISNVYTITAADLGQPLLACLHFTGTQLRLYMRRAQVGADVAAVFGVPGGVAMQVGSRSDGIAFVSGAAFAVQGGHTNPTLAEIQQVFDTFDATGRLTAIPGKTEHLWDLTTDTLASGVDAVPAVVLDRVGTDHLTRVGPASWAGGLTLAQQTTRLWSYETTPILYAVNALTDADHYASTDAVTGNAAGCWFGVPFVIESQSVPSQTRTLIGSGAAGRGWSLSSAGSNSTLGSVLYSGSGAPTNGPVIVVAAADVGKLMLLIVSWDGAGKIHAYIKRAESGAGATMTGFTPALPADPFTLGRHPLNAQAASGIRILGCMGGVGVPSLAEVQAAHDAILALEDLVEIPGKTDYLISVKQDVLANGGALPATLVNRKGAGGLTKVGAPQLAPIYARAAAW